MMPFRSPKESVNSSASVTAEEFTDFMGDLKGIMDSEEVSALLGRNEQWLYSWDNDKIHRGANLEEVGIYEEDRPAAAGCRLGFLGCAQWTSAGMNSAAAVQLACQTALCWPGGCGMLLTEQHACVTACWHPPPSTPWCGLGPRCPFAMFGTTPPPPNPGISPLQQHTSSSVLNLLMTCTGPKISSLLIFMLSFTSVNTVGSMK
jgi:hypothetical protein